MKYWTLFLLRIMARTGLLVSVTIWIVAVLAPIHDSVQIRGGPVHYVDIFQTRLVTRCYVRSDWVTLFAPNHWYGPVKVFRYFQFGGNRFDFYVDIDHLVLFLTFLIATIVTSLKWRKPQASTEQEQADE